MPTNSSAFDEQSAPVGFVEPSENLPLDYFSGMEIEEILNTLAAAGIKMRLCEQGIINKNTKFTYWYVEHAVHSQLNGCRVCANLTLTIPIYMINNKIIKIDGLHATCTLSKNDATTKETENKTFTARLLGMANFPRGLPIHVVETMINIYYATEKLKETNADYDKILSLLKSEFQVLSETSTYVPIDEDYLL
jgi:hypothetical protein